MMPSSSTTRKSLLYEHVFRQRFGQITIRCRRPASLPVTPQFYLWWYFWRMQNDGEPIMIDTDMERGEILLTGSGDAIIGLQVSLSSPMLNTTCFEYHMAQARCFRWFCIRRRFYTECCFCFEALMIYGAAIRFDIFDYGDVISAAVISFFATLQMIIFKLCHYFHNTTPRYHAPAAAASPHDAKFWWGWMAKCVALACLPPTRRTHVIDFALVTALSPAPASPIIMIVLNTSSRAGQSVISPLR